MKIPHSILLWIRTGSEKNYRENQNTHFIFMNIFPLKSWLHEIMWNNIVRSNRPQMKIKRMRIARWIPKTTNTHSKVCNPCCFPTTTIVARKRLIVTLYVHCLSSYLNSCHFVLKLSQLWILKHFSCNYMPLFGPGSSVGIVTDYGLDGPGSNPGGDEIFRPFRTALGPTQRPVKWVPGLSRG